MRNLAKIPVNTPTDDQQASLPHDQSGKGRGRARSGFWKQLLESAEAGGTSTGNGISPECTSDEEMRVYITGGPAESNERARILEHLSRCKRCRQRSIELYREWRSMQTASGSFQPAVLTDPDKIVPPARSWSGELRWLAAAMVVLTVGASGYFLLHRQSGEIWIEPAAGLRSSGQGNIRHFRLDEPADGARLRVGVEARFTWPAIPAAEHYFITIYDSIGTILVEMRTEKPAFQLAPNAHFHPGVRYFWQVLAGSVNAEGSVSEVRSFTFFQ